MKKILFGTTLVFALVLSSCSTFKKVDIVKRHYNNGYHIAIRDQKTKTEPVVTTATPQTPATVTIQDPEERTSPLINMFDYEQPVGAAAVITAEKTDVQPEAKQSAPLASVKKERTKAAHSLRKPEYKSKTWSASRSSSGGDVNLIILVILAIILPPLAVYLAEGITGKFWLTLILCLLGGGLALGVLGYIGLLWLIAIIIALLAVL